MTSSAAQPGGPSPARTPSPAALVAEATVWAADGSPWSGAGYGLRIADRLAALGLEVSLADLGTAEAPEASAGRLNVISGGSTSVSSQTEWMARAQRTVDQLVRAAQEDGEHLLGICLGSQLIAHRTAPGSVIAGSGMQAGLAPLTWRDGRGPAALASFHYERIDRAPLEAAGARIEASNDRVPVLAYTVGPRVAGIQLHPEFDREDLALLLPYNREIIEATGGDQREIDERTERLGPAWRPKTAMLEVLQRLLPELMAPQAVPSS